MERDSLRLALKIFIQEGERVEDYNAFLVRDCTQHSVNQGTEINVMQIDFASDDVHSRLQSEINERIN